MGLNKFKKGFLDMSNLKTVSCSVVFVADNAPKMTDEGVFNYTDKDDIFKGLMNSITLRLILQNLHGDKNIGVESTSDIPNVIYKFKSTNGLEFIFEKPLKFSIIYDANIGTEKEPEKYVKEIADIMIKESGKMKVGAVGINYDFFEKYDNPSEIMKKSFLCDINDSDLEKTAVVLAYKKDLYTKLNLSIVVGTIKNEEGLIYKINFDCQVKQQNNINIILNKNDLIEFAQGKIESLIT
jgi:hypothetical protein